MNSTEGLNYRLILLKELEKRAARNPRYSLRAFARDMGISAPRLSDILKERYGLSRAAAESISVKLGFNTPDATLFCDLVESQHARSPRVKKIAADRLKGANAQYNQISLDHFQVIADWYHYAILELTRVHGFTSDISWIAKKIGINVVVCEVALDRLIRLGLLEKNSAGEYRATTDFFSSPDGVPSEAIRAFHRQIIEKAKDAIDLQSIEERDLSSMVLAIDHKQMPEARAMIKEFRRRFDAKFGISSEKDSVYCLGIQFFKLQQP